MIIFSATRVDRSVPRNVTSPSLITAEGVPLIADNTPGLDNGVAQAAGASGEVFVGISISQQRSLSVISTVDEVVVASDGTFSLNHNSYNSGLQRFAILTGTTEGAALTSNSSPSTSQFYPVSSSTINFITNTGNAGKTIRAYYRYSPTAVQAQMLQGDVLPGGDAGLILNQVGVIVAGDISTTEFDPSVNWNGSLATLALGSGLFTLGGGGTTLLPNVRVIHRPTANEPWLGLSLNNG